MKTENEREWVEVLTDSLDQPMEFEYFQTKNEEEYGKCYFIKQGLVRGTVRMLFPDYWIVTDISFGEGPEFEGERVTFEGLHELVTQGLTESLNYWTDRYEGRYP